MCRIWRFAHTPSYITFQMSIGHMTKSPHCINMLLMTTEAAAAAAVTPPEAAALPGGSAAQRENLKKAQQKHREGAIWRQTAGCICDNLALYWRREGTDFPVTPPAGLSVCLCMPVSRLSGLHSSLSQMGSPESGCCTCVHGLSTGHLQHRSKFLHASPSHV